MPPRQPSLLPHPLLDEFEQWWCVCWRKTKKPYAFKCYRKAREIANASILLEAAKKFAEIIKKRGTERQFQPHPSTWLNNEQWLDDDNEFGAVADEIGGLPKSIWRSKMEMWRKGLMHWNCPGNEPGSGGYIGPLDLITPNELQSERLSRQKNV